CTLRVRLRRAGPLSRRLRSERRMNVWSVKLPFAEYSVVKDLPGEISPPGMYSVGPEAFCPGTPLAFSLAGAQIPAPFRSPLSPTLSNVRRHQTVRRGAPGKQNSVENTGLEPVTSWLQTRRSPS